MYKSLYRKYRPAVFSDMVGQEHIRSVLTRQCESGRLSHAYIFCGTRGTGKTTSAKILAKAVNCLSPVNGEPCGKCPACISIDNGTATDVLELDAASNNKVDDIRTLCDELIYPPTSLKKRVYIIDEVHMLTASAYNALLKTLEEPPEHVMFILATTELQKIPPTILSRCQRFEFRRVSVADLKKRILYVAEQEKLQIDDEGASIIARLADGSVRDSLSLLESCVEAANGGVINKAVVSSQLGIAEDNTISEIFDAVMNRDVVKCLSLLDEYYASAKSLSILLDDLLSSIRDMLFIKQGGRTDGLMSNISADKLSDFSGHFTVEQLIYFAETAEEARNRLVGYALNKRLVTELALIRLCDPRYSDSVQSLAARVALLEKGSIIRSASQEPEPIQKPEEVQTQKPVTVTEQKPEPAKAQPTSNTEVIYEKTEELISNLSARTDICKMMRDASVTVKNDVMIIHVTNAFAKMILSGANAIKAISDAALVTDGRKYEIIISDIKFTNPEENKKYIDEIK